MKVDNKVHLTKDGRRISISELEVSHLKNIIKMQERMAKEGVVLYTMSGSYGDGYIDEEYLYGEDALEYLNHAFYTEELKKRIITT